MVDILIALNVRPRGRLSTALVAIFPGWWRTWRGESSGYGYCRVIRSIRPQSTDNAHGHETLMSRILHFALDMDLTQTKLFVPPRDVCHFREPFLVIRLGLLSLGVQVSS